MKEVLTTGEVAKYCGVNFRTVIRWIEKGYLQSYKLPGRGDNRIPVKSFVEFLESNGMPVPSELTQESHGDDNTATSPEAGAEATNTKILVIEDEELMAKSIKRALVRCGYQVEHASNGIEAGIMLERFQPGLITLDLQMPGMSGFEVLEALKANDNYASIKVLVVSAATKVKMLEVMELGVDGVLEKPFQSSDLIEQVQALMPITAP